MTDRMTTRDGITVREVHQQPEVWGEAASLVAARRDEIDAFLAPLLARSDTRIVLTGAGTSAFVGEVASPALARRLGRTVQAIPTTDIVAVPRDALAGTGPLLLVSFARSGDSPESTAAAALADALVDEVHHLVVTCNPAGRLAREVGAGADALALVLPDRADDRAFAMTSSFTSMVLTVLLAMLGDDDPLVARLAGAAQGVLDGDVDLAPVLSVPHERVVFLGSGSLRGLARESALKLQEVTAGRVDTYWDSPLAFRHGPKAVLGPATAVVAYRSSDAEVRAYDDDMIRELRASGASVLAIGGGLPADGTGVELPVGPVPADAFLALPLVVVAQLLALAVAERLGVDADDPFPAGEVNRVVQGVVIHPLAGEAS